MRRFLLIVIILFCSVSSFPQKDTAKLEKRKHDRYVIWLIPSLSANIYGIAIGPVGSEIICHSPYTKRSHGINVQLGQGFFLSFTMGKFFKDLCSSDDSINKYESDTSFKRVIHNGVLLSVFGTLTTQVNGISISPFMSYNRKVNGLSVNLFWNFQRKMNGVAISLINTCVQTRGTQIGLYNKSCKLKGIQFGLWNVNEKRSLPILNWNFKNN